uniref:Uncharacterized protein n=1 Tax=Oryza glaberrima TaxID=4538 RepID=I1QL10_ORYGL
MAEPHGGGGGFGRELVGLLPSLLCERRRPLPTTVPDLAANFFSLPPLLAAAEGPSAAADPLPLPSSRASHQLASPLHPHVATVRGHWRWWIRP